MSKGNKAKYTAIGYVVSKVVIPIAKKQAKKQARAKARNAAVSSKNAVVGHPAKTSIAVGAIVGAAAWLFTRKGDDTGE